MNRAEKRKLSKVKDNNVYINVPKELNEHFKDGDKITISEANQIKINPISFSKENKKGNETIFTVSISKE